MPKFTQKFTIIALLEDVEEGYEFPSNAWPLHITIADTFAVKCSTEELIAELTKKPDELKPATAVASSDEYFGPEQQTHVVILDMSKELIALHYDVINMLKEGGLTLNDPQYSESGFRAHSTVQPHARVNIGDSLKITNLALVDMFPGEDPYQRKILKIVQL